MSDHTSKTPIQTAIEPDGMQSGDVPGAQSMSRTEQVADRLRDMIVLEGLKDGERLRERNLAQLFNVSRTPLREALKLLAAEGLVDLSPNRGARVTGLSRTDTAEKLQVLGALERLAGELACARVTDQEISEIKALHYEMLAAFSREDRKAYFRSNQAIHLAIVKLSGNASLVDTHVRLNNQLFRVRYMSNLKNERWHTAIEEHEVILAALIARDGIRLGQLLFDHLGSTWFKVSELLGNPDGNLGKRSEG